jgi:hypothetical protein
MRLVDGASEDILRWHSGGDCSHAVDGTPALKMIYSPLVWLKATLMQSWNRTNN